MVDKNRYRRKNNSTLLAEKLGLASNLPPNPVLKIFIDLSDDIPNDNHNDDLNEEDNTLEVPPPNNPDPEDQVPPNAP